MTDIDNDDAQIYPRKKGHLHALLPTGKACNICGNFFYAENKFVHFCKRCRENSDLYRFADYIEAA